MPITLDATEVPLPMTFSGTTPVIADVAPGTGPLTSEMMTSGQPAPFTTKLFNQNALRHDLTARYGAGFYFLADGGALTAGSGLSLNVAFLHAMVDGPVEIDAQALALTDSTRNHIWAKRDGTLEARTDLTHPSQAAAYLGSALCAAGVISSVDESGVVYSKTGHPWRETADAGVPGDTPTAALAGLITKTAGGVYLWDGTDYQLLAPSGGGSVLGVGSGGTGADLSATGGAAEVVMQETVGGDFTVRVLAAADLPTATTSAQGAVELATDGEILASRAVQGDDSRIQDFGQILFPALEVLGTDASLIEAGASSFNAMLFVPRQNMSIRYIYVAKGNADAAESSQAAIYGPVDRPVRGSRIITPSTDSPVLLAKCADVVAPSALGLAPHDVGATALLAGRAYWIVWQNEEAMNVLRLTIRVIGPGLSAGVMTTAQQLMFIATAGAPAYGTNFGSIGVATLAGITWNANTTQMPVLAIS